MKVIVSFIKNIMSNISRITIYLLATQSIIASTRRVSEPKDLSDKLCLNNQESLINSGTYSNQLFINSQFLSQDICTLNSQENYPSTYLKDELNKIKMVKLSGDLNNPEIIDLLPSEKRRINKALIAINNEFTLELILKANTNINIVSESYMRQITGIDDYSACYVSYPHSTILLNEHLFKESTAEKQEQLIALLANEISHATIHNHHPLKNSITKENFQQEPYKILVPWISEKQKKEFVNAIKSFFKNVQEYGELIQKSEIEPLTKNEIKKLVTYDNALLSYITPRYGVLGYNAMQESWIELEDEKLRIERDSANIAPGKSKQKERLNYLRQNFFVELKNKEVQYKVLHGKQIGFYQNNSDQKLADLLSDFETLPPAMRKTFGNSLCKLLSQYFNVEDHCHRPNWPK